MNHTALQMPRSLNKSRRFRWANQNRLPRPLSNTRVYDRDTDSAMEPYVLGRRNSPPSLRAEELWKNAAEGRIPKTNSNRYQYSSHRKGKNLESEVQENQENLPSLRREITLLKKGFQMAIRDNLKLEAELAKLKARLTRGGTRRLK